MSTRLILYVGEHWPQSPALPWVLLDGADRRLQEGHSDPRHWPAAERCEVVLGANQALWLETRIPKAPRREHERLLHYALEERLAGDPDTQHLTVTSRVSLESGQQLQVLVVDQARLRTILAQLEAVGRAPQRMVSILQGVRPQSERWQLTVGPSGETLLHAAPPLVLPLERDSVTAVLEQALSQARARNKAPASLQTLAASGQHAPDLASLETTHALRVENGPAWSWWDAVRLGSELLHGSFAPRRGNDHWASRLRLPAKILLSGAALYLVLLSALTLWNTQQLHALEARQLRLFQTAMPNMPAVSPAAQLHREVEMRRGLTGKLRDDDALALLQSYMQARGTAATGSLNGVKYEAGKLELNLRALPTGEADILRARLADRGVLAQPDPQQPTHLILVRAQP